MTRRALVIVWLSVGALSAGGAREQSPKADLDVAVKGLRNSTGSVRVALFRSEDGYPEDYTKAAVSRSRKASAPDTSIRFEGLSPGVYALALLHDENENRKLDRNFLGVPVEGIGASNDAVRTMGPPKFDVARFELAVGETNLVIRVHYWL